MIHFLTKTITALMLFQAFSDDLNSWLLLFFLGHVSISRVLHLIVPLVLVPCNRPSSVLFSSWFIVLVLILGSGLLCFPGFYSI